MHLVIFPRIVNLQPIPGGRVVFTDGSSSGITVVISQTVIDFSLKHNQHRLLKLAALVLALQLFPSEVLSIYTDSQYVTQIFPLLESATYIAPMSRVYPCFSYKDFCSNGLAHCL